MSRAVGLYSRSKWGWSPGVDPSVALVGMPSMAVGQGEADSSAL